MISVPNQLIIDQRLYEVGSMNSGAEATDSVDAAIPADAANNAAIDLSSR